VVFGRRPRRFCCAPLRRQVGLAVQLCAATSGCWRRSGDTYRPLLATMLFTGVRLGELRGLTWADVDVDAAHVHIRYQLDRTRQRVSLKTGAGRRDVVLIPQLASILRQQKKRAFAFGRAKPQDFVFAGPDGQARVEQTRHANELRDKLEQGFGHLLADVNGMSTAARFDQHPAPRHNSR